eukprot:3433165-Prymnesium_polylepis.1
MRGSQPAHTHILESTCEGPRRAWVPAHFSRREALRACARATQQDYGKRYGGRYGSLLPISWRRLRRRYGHRNVSVISET